MKKYRLGKLLRILIILTIVALTYPIINL